MSSTTPDEKQWKLTWDSLPSVVRHLIIQKLTEDGCTLASLATVSREWQAEIEPHNFARLRLTPSRLANFGVMINRNRALVRYIWFCLELDDYCCARCGAQPHVAWPELPKEERENLSEDAFEALMDQRIEEENKERESKIKEICHVNDTVHCPISTAFHDLFSVLSSWKEGSGHSLTLDISLYSPSDSEHYFKYLTFLPDVPAGGSKQGGPPFRHTTFDATGDDPAHGWVGGFQNSAPPPLAIEKIFWNIMGPYNSDDEETQELRWWDQLPSVPAITSLILRQQTRRRWRPKSLAHIIARLPGLKELHYEPWRLWKKRDRVWWDQEHENLLESLPKTNNKLERLVIFENFNQRYSAIMNPWFVFSDSDTNDSDTDDSGTDDSDTIESGTNNSGTADSDEGDSISGSDGSDTIDSDTTDDYDWNDLDTDDSDSDDWDTDDDDDHDTRKPSQALCRKAALASLQLEHFAASFNVDAAFFFEIEPSWEWPNLKSLALTSISFTPSECPTKLKALLKSAAAAATRMPQLETLELWNGQEGLAALFKYEYSRDARMGTITWKSTWKWTMDTATVRAWEAVVFHCGGWKLGLVYESLDEEQIKSHGDALHHLMLSSQVIRPVSLHQIRTEHEMQLATRAQ